VTRIVVLGDTLLDRDIDGRAERLAPDAPAPVVDEQARHSRPGGAGLAAVLAARDGREVTLVTALARDGAGDELRALLGGAGVEIADIGLDGATPEKIRVRASGRPLLRLDRGGDGGPPGPLTAAARAALENADAVLVSDYGRGLAARDDVRRALAGLDPDVPLVWDPHPRGPDPVRGARHVTPNAAEPARVIPAPARDAQGAVAEAAARGAALARRWHAVGVCVTLGARGAVLAFADGTPLAVPTRAAEHGDACGAGDRFASALAGLLADGQLPSQAVGGAVAVASSFVAAGGAGAIRPGTDEEGDRPRAPEDAPALAHRIRAAGGTVVATGGCFDLLHAGHAAMLAAARSLGDCLVVCLNSDASVRRLKGEARPVVGEQDRAELLSALECVDAVVVFDEDVPERVLRDLRPHLFVKGGDYHAAELPEAATLAEWGGRAVTVPFVAGRSTSQILKEVARRGA
jgi:rfaE bifunctional protein nucleotidyltransferase chain/domain/rfaE bifunctional protein kinase chain/domain